MIISIHSRFKQFFLLLFVISLAGTSLLFSQEPQNNRLSDLTEIAGIMTKDYAVSGPVRIHQFLPEPDSSRILTLKDSKGNEVKLTIKDLNLQRRAFYIPEGHKLTVDKGAYYWYGSTFTKHAP